MRVRLRPFLTVAVRLDAMAVLFGGLASGAKTVALHHLAAAAPDQVREALASNLLEEVEAQTGRQPELRRRLVAGVEVLVVSLRALHVHQAALLPIDPLAVD